MTYRADFGLDFLMSLVDLEAPEPRPIRRTELSVEEVLRGVPFPNVSQEVASWYEQPRKKLDDLDAVSRSGFWVLTCADLHLSAAAGPPSRASIE
jgi:hypothetical protein